MPQITPGIVINLPDAILSRLDTLVERLANDDYIQALVPGALDRATIIRIAIVEGLRVLESRVAIAIDKTIPQTLAATQRGGILD